ncbi:MAG: hypothetical protein GQ550_05625, partial [Gammaproteobacteria bacterium]|nr:hypothetical protein [Gammaproteobacteria bacterium]
MSTQNAIAVPNLTTSSAAFTSADPARANSYMDAGGVWNGTNEVSNTVGDTFTLTITNTAPGLPADDSAFDLQDIQVTVDNNFNLVSNTLSINNIVGVGGGCPNISVGNAGQSGNTITLPIGNNEDVLPGCSYVLSFGLTTANAVTAGNHLLSYSISYDDDAGAPLNTVVGQNVNVNTGDLVVTKTTVTTSAVTNDVITYNVSVSSIGTGGLFDVQLSDVLSADLNGLTFNILPPPPGSAGPGANDYTFEYLAASETVNLTVEATVTPVNVCPVLDNNANLSERRGIAIASVGPVNVPFDFQFISGTTSNVLSHAATSYCEFCGDGIITLTVQNPTNAPLTNISLLEDLQASGLIYIAGTTTFNAVAVADPTITGGSNEELTWSLPDIAGSGSVIVSFGVRSANAEDLITAVRDIIATVDFDMSCLTTTQTVNSGQYEVPIRQPIPNIFKDARNTDAGQTGYTDPIFGSFNDDIIWRVNVQNAGLANMQALLMNDATDSPPNDNFDINFICPTEGDALAITNNNGVNPGGTSCINIAGNNPFDVDDPFGNAADPDDISLSSSDAFIYYVGRIDDKHTTVTNSADISWGCEVDSPTGGSITVPASTNSVTPSVGIIETGTLNTTVTPGSSVITQTVTGSNTGQLLGSKGLITITLNNQTGGSIQDITIATDLPAGYVMDESYGPANGVGIGQPTSATAAAYGGTYDGFIDTFTRDDPELNNGDPLDDLNPTFTLTSLTTGDDAAQQIHMLRNGDVVSFTFGIVMTDPTYFDLVADLDLAEEASPTSDPLNAITNLDNTVNVNFNVVDTSSAQLETRNFTYDSDPEDLDIAISDALFILTNDPGTPLDLNVLLTNNGGHDADDHTTYITFGQAMTVQGVPGGCVGPVANPPPEPHWNDPAGIPGTAVVYACDRGVLASGATETFTFTVTKTNAPAIDDLTFRADVFGAVTTFDGNVLVEPAPPVIPDTEPAGPQLANNYSFDAIRSRVLGFNLVKSAWYCAEDDPTQPPVPADILSPAAAPPNSPLLTGNLDSQIGEDCAYRVESGGWFGFVTPGFNLIEVQDITVTDDLPDGQGFIDFNFGVAEYNFTSTPGIILNGANGGAGTTPLSETDIAWNFNAVAGSGIGVADEFFRVDFKTRLLNDPVDQLYPVPGGYSPNLHGNASTNIARTSFTAVFQSDPIGGIDQPIIPITVDETLNIPGYPAETGRRVDLTDVEPNLIVTKQVCNESLYGTGPGCSAFADTINDGDTDDLYIYRITLTNETTAPIRSPAYNVISTDTLDASGLMIVDDLMADGMDNDNDGFIDVLDLNGEGTITGNTVGVPAV